MSEGGQAGYLGRFEASLRLRGAARARVVEEIRGHLAEMGAREEPTSVLGSPELLARRFGEVYAVRATRRVVTLLGVVGPLVMAAYVLPAALVSSGLVDTAPSGVRLTPALYRDVDLVNVVSGLLLTLALVAIPLTLGALTCAVTLAPVRRYAVLSLAAFGVVSVPPLLALEGLASPTRWLLAAAVVLVASVVAARRAPDLSGAVRTLAGVAIAGFTVAILLSVVLALLHGLPYPDSLAAFTYAKILLAPACLGALAATSRSVFPVRETVAG